MNADTQINLALILFLPWYAILAWAYWTYPKAPRGAARRRFDACALVLTVLLAILAMRWGYFGADTSVGLLWRQVLATSVSYGAFLASLTAAFFIRRHWIVQPFRARASLSQETNR